QPTHTLTPLFNCRERVPLEAGTAVQSAAGVPVARRSAKHGFSLQIRYGPKISRKDDASALVPDPACDGGAGGGADQRDRGLRTMGQLRGKSASALLCHRRAPAGAPRARLEAIRVGRLLARAACPRPATYPVTPRQTPRFSGAAQPRSPGLPTPRRRTRRLGSGC